MTELVKSFAVVMPLIGSALSTDQTVKQGFAIRKEKYYEARQLDENAGQQIAAASHQVGDEIRKYELMQSRALAMFSMGGGGVSDNSVLNHIAGIAEEGERNSQRIMYSAKSKSKLMTEQASASRFEGDQAVKGARRKGIATLLSGAGQAAVNYYGVKKHSPYNPLAGA